mgnify:CR=1 FL=1
MAQPYVHLTYDEYKAFERACKKFRETTHHSTDGSYHKSIRLPVGPLTIEFHGPLWKVGYVDG